MFSASRLGIEMISAPYLSLDYSDPDCAFCYDLASYFAAENQQGRKNWLKNIIRTQKEKHVQIVTVDCALWMNCDSVTAHSHANHVRLISLCSVPCGQY